MIFVNNFYLHPQIKRSFREIETTLCNSSKQSFSTFQKVLCYGQKISILFFPFKDEKCIKKKKKLNPQKNLYTKWIYVKPMLTQKKL